VKAMYPWGEGVLELEYRGPATLGADEINL